MGATRMEPKSPGQGRVPLFAAVALVLLAACLMRVPGLMDRAQDPERFAHGPGLPVLTNLDGYHYLAGARDLMRRWNGQPPLPTADPGRTPTMLEASAAGAAALTGLPVEQVALYLPPLAALLMVFFYFFWGRTTGEAGAGLFAALAGIAAPILFRRTAPGFFDTDALNPFFTAMAALMAYRFAKGRGLARWAWLAGCLACLAGLGWWWRPGIAAAVFVLLVAAYALSVFTPELRRDRAAKYALLGLTVAAVAGVLLFMDHLPVPLREFLQSAAAHLHLVAKQASGALPEIGASITELSRPSPAEAAAALGGWPLALAGLAGLGLMAWKKPGSALFLLPLLALGGLGFAAKRFLIFAVPLAAVGFGQLASALWRPAKGGPRLAIACGALAVLALAGYYCLRDPILPFATGREVELATEIGNKTPPDTVVWTWWDYGYLVEYAAERRAFITGGSQSPLRTYVAARGLAAPDPAFAARWIRFFAAHGPDAFTALARESGGQDKAAVRLENMFANPADGTDYFFPDSPPVALYLPATTMNMAAWIFQYGTWDFASRTSAEPAIARIDNQGWKVDRASGLLVCELGTLPLAGLGVLEKDGSLSALAFDPQRDAELAAAREWAYAYVLGKRMARMLMVRLLARAPASTPGFAPLAYGPAVGGAWLVDRP